MALLLVAARVTTTKGASECIQSVKNAKDVEKERDREPEKQTERERERERKIERVRGRRGKAIQLGRLEAIAAATVSELLAWWIT